MAQQMSFTNRRFGDGRNRRKRKLVSGALMPMSLFVKMGFPDTCFGFSNPPSVVHIPSIRLGYPLSKQLPLGPFGRQNTLFYKHRLNSQLSSSFPPQQDFMEDDEWESYLNVDSSEPSSGNIFDRFDDSLQNNQSQLVMPGLRTSKKIESRDFEGRMFGGFGDYEGEFDSYLDLDMEAIKDEPNDYNKNKSTYANGKNIDKSESEAPNRNALTPSIRGENSGYVRAKTRGSSSSNNKANVDATKNIANLQDQPQSRERQQSPSMVFPQRFKTKPILKDSADDYGSKDSRERLIRGPSDQPKKRNFTQQRLKGNKEPLKRFRVDPTISRVPARFNDSTEFGSRQSANKSSPSPTKESISKTNLQSSNAYPKTKRNSTPKIQNPSSDAFQPNGTVSSKENLPEIPSSITLSPQTNSRRRIPPEEISHIKSTINIVDAIETYNLPQFSRSSSYSSQNSAKACCPFHDDSHPSMSIDGKRGLYKCFACGAGGDVFNFIREYDALDKRNGDKKMGYMQAVEFAAKEFGDASLVEGWGYLGGVERGKSKGMSTEQVEKLRGREKKKERIRQANTAAAAFYAKCLLSLPAAGKARSHLRSRNISPESIREFAFGYAPDCYFQSESSRNAQPGNEKNKAANGKKPWGEGSLVEYLANLGFTPDEIVESGLAVRTKGMVRKRGVGISVKDGTLSPNETDDRGRDEEKGETIDESDYSSLMDRFRGRLVVPIMDASGTHVIAFGGRHLEIPVVDETDDTKRFTPAKYINSPDSLIFTKKDVLFNEHRAKSAMDEMTSQHFETEDPRSRKNTFKTPPAVIVVEGYFDAISLANINVRNVVASMGTALPYEQLKKASAMANVPGGRIILCMDSDEAGKNAVERLCTNSILALTSELNRNEIYVASLPSDTKDPSDFVDFAGGGIRAKEQFEKEIIDTAQPLDEWYIDRVVSRYDPDAKDGNYGSFSSVCNEISSFLSTFSNPADRTRRAYNISEKLSNLIASDLDKNSSSIGMMRVQLETDIINMSARKASAREAMERRIEQADGFAGDSAVAKIRKMSSGEGMASHSEDDTRKMSKSALAKINSPVKTPSRKKLPPRKLRNLPPQKSSNPRRSTDQRSTNSMNRNNQPPIVPHFNGFTFKHQTDMDWLGISGKSKRNMHLGSTASYADDDNRLRAETSVFNTNSIRSNRRKPDVVYFNSNEYLGTRYLTADAINAGYTVGNDRPRQGESLLQFTERKLLEVDADSMILQAESRLLHALAKFPTSRAAMRTVYSASTFSPSKMKWTDNDREWLFLCLTGSQDIIPPIPDELLDGGTAHQLHSHLANREDCPVNAFKKKSICPSAKRFEESIDDLKDSKMQFDSYEGVESGNAEFTNEEDMNETSGTLDEYFFGADDLFPSSNRNAITDETRAELTVQETVATLLRATAMKRFSIAKSKFATVVYEMDRRCCSDQTAAAENELEDMSSEELDDLFRKLGHEVTEAQKSLYEADRSFDRVNSHLLDYSVSNGVHYKQSQAKIEKLNKVMEEHIANLPDDSQHRPDTPGDDGTYMFGSDEFDKEIDSQFGGKNPDNYVTRGLPNGETKWA